MPVMLAFGKCRQEDQNSKLMLSYTVSSGLAWATKPNINSDIHLVTPYAGGTVYHKTKEGTAFSSVVHPQGIDGAQKRLSLGFWGKGFTSHMEPRIYLRSVSYYECTLS